MASFATEVTDEPEDEIAELRSPEETALLMSLEDRPTLEADCFAESATYAYLDSVYGIFLITLDHTNRV